MDTEGKEYNPMNNIKPREKNLRVRLPEYLYSKLKNKSVETYKSMNLIILELLRDKLK